MFPNDEYGKMPSLDEMLGMRGDDCNNSAYAYIILVFATAVCGESVTKEVFDFDPSDKNIPEDEKKRWWKKAAKKITPNNEAFMLTILEDNWDVWTLEATLQLKWSIKALDPIWYGDMNVEKEQVSEQVDK